jgi:hypothetical protein
LQCQYATLAPKPKLPLAKRECPLWTPRAKCRIYKNVKAPQWEQKFIESVMQRKAPKETRARINLRNEQKNLPLRVYFFAHFLAHVSFSCSVVA